MVKKLKAMAEKKNDTAQLADAVRDSAQQIWLAGLGAFSKARADRTKAFETLVKEGKSLQLRTKALAEERLGEVSGRVNEVREKVSRQATESWDKLEQVFEDRVSRALGRLGVPTSKDVQSLMKRVDDLTESVRALGGATPRKASAPAKKSAKPAARKSAKAGKAAGAVKAPKAAARAKAPRAAGPAKAEKAPAAPKAPRAPKVAKAPAAPAQPEASESPSA